MISSISKVKLAQEVSKKLCEDIASERWCDALPPERELARIYGISRRVLREAIQILTVKKVLEHRDRRPPGILKKKHVPHVEKPITIAMLSPFPLDMADPEVLRLIQVLSTRLQTQNIDIRFVVGAGYYTTGFGRLRQLLSTNKADCWIIYRCPPKMQKFLAAAKYPVVILGTSSPELGLPCVDMDRHSSCFHGVGKLARAGYTRLCLFVPEDHTLGDEACIRGFQEGCALGDKSLRSDIIAYKDDPEAIQKAVERYVRKIDIPTGILTTRVRPSILVLSHILRMGIDVPRQVGVLSTDWTPLFTYISPALAGYQVEYQQLAKRLMHQVLAVAHGESLRKPQQFLIPEFQPGSTCL